MRKLLLLLSFVSIVAHADWVADATAARKANAEILSKLPDYSCFAEETKFTPTTPWEKPIISLGEPYMLVTQNKDYILFAQPHPQLCDEVLGTVCKIYWLRTEGKNNLTLFQIGRPTKCPRHLTKKFIREYIQRTIATKSI